jgi:hypothetical protein
MSTAKSKLSSWNCCNPDTADINDEKIKPHRDYVFELHYNQFQSNYPTDIPYLT